MIITDQEDPLKVAIGKLGSFVKSIVYVDFASQYTYRATGVSQKKVHKYEIKNFCSNNRSIRKVGVVC